MRVDGTFCGMYCFVMEFLMLVKQCHKPPTGIDRLYHHTRWCPRSLANLVYKYYFTGVD